jgi:hypothetical protein
MFDSVVVLLLNLLLKYCLFFIIIGIEIKSKTAIIKHIITKISFIVRHQATLFNSLASL